MRNSQIFQCLILAYHLIFASAPFVIAQSGNAFNINDGDPNPYTYTVGQTYTISWATGNAPRNKPVALLILEGDANNLQTAGTVGVLPNNPGSYVWIPPKSISGGTYVFEIAEEGTDPNYSPMFTVESGPDQPVETFTATLETSATPAASSRVAQATTHGDTASSASPASTTGSAAASDGGSRSSVTSANASDATSTQSSSSSSFSSSPSSSGKPSNSSPPIGAIVGGVVGGVAVLSITGLVAFWIHRNSPSKGRHSSTDNAPPMPELPPGGVGKAELGGVERVEAPGSPTAAEMHSDQAFRHELA